MTTPTKKKYRRYNYPYYWLYYCLGCDFHSYDKEDASKHNFFEDENHTLMRSPTRKAPPNGVNAELTK